MPQLGTLRGVEHVEASNLQPATVVVAYIKAVSLRQLVQCRFEEDDCIILFAPFLGAGEGGI